MEIQNKIYRFKLNAEIANELDYFAKIHQYDDRKSFKDAWKEWIEKEDIRALLDSEQKQLLANGFTGDVIDKMFKSARYYYRKKPEKSDDEKKEKQIRKVYVGFSDKILEIMDQDIFNQLNSHKISEIKNENKQVVKVNLSPAKAYNLFCENNKEAILNETILYMEKNPKPLDKTSEQYKGELISKFKKTYKNRFYMIAH